MLRLFTLAAGFILLWSTAWAAGEPAALTILAKSKQAAGGAAWDNIQLVRSELRVSTSGLSGTGDSLEDVKTGRFVSHYDLGALKGASGYDGSQVWNQDPSGQVTIEGGEDAREGAVDQAYITMRAFWYPERMAADIALAGTKSEGGRSFDIVRITPQGGRPFDLWIDHKTHLFDRSVEQSATETDTTYFSDYRVVDGKEIAYATHENNGQDAKYDIYTDIQSVSFESAAPVDAFAPPPPPKPDFGFTKGTSTSVPMQLVNNHMFVDVMLNGKGPYELIFDTGGRNVITPALASELGVKSEGALAGGGVGDKTTDVGLAKIDRMTIGNAWLDNQSFAVIDIGPLSAIEGRPVVGIFGYEVFKRFIVRTDYGRNRITLIDPKGFHYTGNGVRVPFTFKDGDPIITGSIDGIAGTFRLDTGSRHTLDLSTPFVDKNHLLDRYTKKVEGVTGWGIGGPARGYTVRGNRLSFAGIDIANPVVGLSEQEKGALSDIYLSGNIGAGVLKRFNIVWNYGGQEIFFEKNANFDKPDVFDRAGFWANLGNQSFDVVDVYTGSPAQQAGLKTGDRILKVNGRRAGEGISLAELRSLTLGRVGSKLKLDIERDGKPQHLTITLRELI